MSEVSIQKLKLIVAKVRSPNTIDGGENNSPEIDECAAIENSAQIDLKSKRKNTKVNVRLKICDLSM